MLASNAAVPHESTEGDKVEGYDAVFHDTTYDNSEEDPTGEGWAPRRLRMGPDGHHESNHGPDCRAKYSGMATCVDARGVNLARQLPDDEPDSEYFWSLDGMTFPDFTYALRVINELQNKRYNVDSLRTAVGRIDGHPLDMLTVCETALRTCGRCFCSKPLVRVFDCLGRLEIEFLSAVLAR